MPSTLDSKVADLLDRSQTEIDDDEDDLIDELEDDPEIDAFREKRRQQLHEEFSRAQRLKNNSHGVLTSTQDEKFILDTTTSTKHCVVHFSKTDFRRCEIMNAHLEQLAPLHLDCRFLKINVDDAPFLVTKLQIQVLPCVLVFEDGIAVDRIVGFEGLGRGTDRFTTKDLEQRLLDAGVLMRPKVSVSDASMNVPTIMASNTRSRRDQVADDDDDWD